MEVIEGVKQTTAEDLGALLDAGTGAVVTLAAGDTLLVAHRAVLAARSLVFSAMFGHDMLEASSGQVSVEGPVLRQLVAYCYAPQAPRQPGTAAQLLAAADKYGVSALKAERERLIATQLTVETAAATAVLSVRDCCTSLRQATITFVKAHIHQVMATQGWADAVIMYPEDVVEVSRLLDEPPEETSAPAAGGSNDATARSHRWAHGDRARTQDAAAASMPLCHTAPPEGAAVSPMWNLSAEEKGRKLIQAAEEGIVEELRTLLTAEAHVGASCGDRRTALHWAAARGHVPAVRCLLASGSAVDTRDWQQSTPLHFAALNGHASVVRLLVASYADPNSRDQFGEMPLHDAARCGHSEAAAALLDAGAYKAARDDDGNTPLDIARRNDYHELIEMLT